MTYFTELQKSISKLYMEQKRLCTATAILRKRNKVGGIVQPNIKLYYKAIVTNRAWYWHRNRHIDPWNRIESPGINPRFCSQIILDRISHHIPWAKDSLFNEWC